MDQIQSENWKHSTVGREETISKRKVNDGLRRSTNPWRPRVKL